MCDSTARWVPGLVCDLTFEQKKKLNRSLDSIDRYRDRWQEIETAAMQHVQRKMVRPT